MRTAEEILLDKDRKMICIDHDKPVIEALKLMSHKNIGAILVQKNEELAGIWTERDLLRNSLEDGFDLTRAPIGDHMSHPLHTAPHDAPLADLQEIFLGLFIRHLIIEKQGRFIGLISVGDVVRANLLEKDREIKNLKKMASWQYYENWGWDREGRREIEPTLSRGA